MEHLYIPKDSAVLDLGTGSGILAIAAAERAQKVVASDISPYATHNTRINVHLNKLSNKITILKGNLFHPIHEKFDIILFNPPYYPFKPKTYIEAAWCGGENYALLRRFLSQAKGYLNPNGVIQISASSYTDLNFIKRLFKKHNFHPIMVARKFLFFEILYIYLLIPQKPGGVIP
jgi:release factor glutamine methyltransferase